MLELGESGRYEFERDVDKVSVRLLATLTNWVALDPDREVAHLLVGVDEVEDPESVTNQFRQVLDSGSRQKRTPR
ncbi:MAG: hypothetical protein V9F03_10105 [Microthrixaceae bacterium]